MASWLFVTQTWLACLLLGQLCQWDGGVSEVCIQVQFQSQSIGKVTRGLQYSVGQENVRQWIGIDKVVQGASTCTSPTLQAAAVRALELRRGERLDVTS
jgi:hypothetical protein